jgi:hypothetical protein
MLHKSGKCSLLMGVGDDPLTALDILKKQSIPSVQYTTGMALNHN